MIEIDAVLKKQFMGKQILITGGLGFIGSNLANRLIDYGANIVLHTRTTSKMRNIKDISAKVSIVKGSINDQNQMAELVKPVDYIFHLAAQTSNIVSMESPLQDLKTNAEGTLTLLESCRYNNSNSSIVSVGSVTEVGKPLRLPVDESHPDTPLSIYDANKIACEKYLNIYHRAYGLRTTFLRLATIFGERQSVKSTKVGIINYFIAKAMKGENIKIFGDGNYLRDYVYIQDLVDALLLSASADNTAGESFVLATGTGTRFVDMVETIISTVNEITGVQVCKEHVPWPKEWEQIDVGSFVGAPEKLKKATGWYPRNSFKEGIRKTVVYYSKHLQEYL